MSRFAAILMFFAWLLYGAMPAMAMPAAPTPMAMTHSMPGHQGHEQMNGMQSADMQMPCPHGAKGCMAPFCAACLTLLPEVDIGSDAPFAHGLAGLQAEPSIFSQAPAPLTPPPRA